MKFFLLALFVAAAVAAPTPLDDESQAVEVIVNGVPDGEALEISHLVDITLKEQSNGVEASSSDLLHPYTAVGLAEAALAASAAIVPSEVNLVEAPQPIAIEVPTPVVLPQPAIPVVPSPISLPAPVLPSVPETPSPISLPSPVLPTVPAVPSPVVLPAPVVPTVPEVPSPIVLPAPVVPTVPEIPSPIVMPAPVAPEVPSLIPSPVIVQEPSAGVPVLIPSPLIVEDVAPVQEAIRPVPEPAAQHSNEVYNDGIVQVQLNDNSAGVMSALQSWFNMVINYFNGGAISSYQVV